MNLTEAQARSSLESAKSLLEKAPREVVFSQLSAFLRESFPRYRWTGVYLLEGQELFLSGWAGEHATEHTTIPLSKGVCGMAAREKRTVNVEDVRARPEYLACFIETRSEIVVPIMDGDVCLGEIDIDGKELGAYDASDERFLEAVARLLVPYAREALKHPSRR